MTAAENTMVLALELQFAAASKSQPNELVPLKAVSRKSQVRHQKTAAIHAKEYVMFSELSKVVPAEFHKNCKKDDFGRLIHVQDDGHERLFKRCDIKKIKNSFK